MKDSQIVGEALAQVLPQTNKYWFQQSHLLRLNLILLIPLLSSSVSGYDGMLCCPSFVPSVYKHGPPYIR